MDAAELARVYEAFQDFHNYFGSAFGRKQPRELSRDYLQGLLVQSEERRNAENLSEMVGASPRSLQRFLTESPWDDDVVIGRLQEYLGTRLEDPQGVWVLDGSDFPKQGVPAERRGYQSKTELALEMVERAQARGHLKAQWVAGDAAFGMSPALREGLSAVGMRFVLDARPDATVWPVEPTWTDPPYQGRGQPRKPKPLRQERQTVAQRSLTLPEDAWREITIAVGSQGPRTYRYSAQRVRVTHRRTPGEILWAIYRQNRDGSEPRYYLSNAPEDTPLKTLAYVGGSRWRIETEFETEKSDVGLDEYETRTWAGWHHHIAMCLLAGALLHHQGRERLVETQRRPSLCPSAGYQPAIGLRR